MPIHVSTAPTGRVTLNWARPSSNEDGSALTDLAGYKVYYGDAPYGLETSVDVHGGNVTSVEIQGWRTARGISRSRPITRPASRVRNQAS